MRHLVWILPSLALLVAASPVIYPDQRLPLVFDHGQHATLGATCTDCHAKATTSRSAVDDLLPGEDACRECHKIDRRSQTGCETCHQGYVAGQPPARVYIPPPNLKFDHQAHAGRGIECAGCHDLAGVGLATRDHLPSMALCLECHDGKAADDDCSVCHLTEVGVLQTTFQAGALIPTDHEVDFVRTHGRLAARDEGYCASCHRESECTECHDGVVKPEEFHPADYVAFHAVDARRNQPDCGACHRAQTFCVGCHERSGVGTRDTDFDQDDPDARYHPANWVDERHAREARANLNTCVSCHREDDCLECHTAEPGGPRFSPHGAGWRGSRRCESLAAKNPRVCLRCHIDEVEMRCDF